MYVVWPSTHASIRQVGNRAYADWVDENIPDFTHINNLSDIVPILPGRFLGFVHPGGEKHISGSPDNWVDCPGQDNTSGDCIAGTVKNVFEGSVPNHLGPYDGLFIGACEPSDST